LNISYSIIARFLLARKLGIRFELDRKDLIRNSQSQDGFWL